MKNLALLLFGILFLFSCEEESALPPTTPPPTVVYENVVDSVVLEYQLDESSYLSNTGDVNRKLRIQVTKEGYYDEYNISNLVQSSYNISLLDSFPTKHKVSLTFSESLRKVFVQLYNDPTTQLETYQKVSLTSYKDGAILNRDSVLNTSSPFYILSLISGQ
jgi:hypothetical protein